MGALTFETIFTTDIRDSKGSVMSLVELTAINGSYTTGGLLLEPEDFGLKSIEFIGVNNFFAFPQTDGSYDVNGAWTKVVDFMPTKVQNEDGGFDWKLLIFLYPIDSAELPEVPMGFVPQVPIRLMVLGTNKPGRRTL